MKFIKEGNTNKLIFDNDLKFSEIEVHDDKYFYDRKRTVGLRNDKKLHKFVGLRDGYSKQLEFTLKSIKIDGDEKIASNRVNFSDIILSGDTVIHKINDIEIYNWVDLENYKNLIKTNSNFSDFEVTYEVHIKDDMKFNNFNYVRSNNRIFKPDHKDKYNITDINNNILFVIDTPVAVIDGDEYDMLIHELVENDGKYYYKKIIKKNKIKDKILYIDINITFDYISMARLKNRVGLPYYTGTENDLISVVNDIIDGDDGLLTRDTGFNTYVSNYFYKQDPIPPLSPYPSYILYLERLYFAINTSYLLDIPNIMINEATLHLLLYSKSDGTEQPYMAVQKSNFSENIPTTTKSDWNSYQGSPYFVKGTTSRRFRTWTSQANYSGSIDIQVPVSDIERDSISKFMIRSFDYDYNYDNTFPTLPYNSTTTFVDGSTTYYIDSYRFYQFAAIGSSQLLELDIQEQLVTETITVPVKLNTRSGFGVISSSYITYNGAKNGVGDKILIHESRSIYNKSVGYEYNNTINEHILYRTYLNFNTSLLTIYKNFSIKSVSLNILNSTNNNGGISVYKGTQDSNLQLDPSPPNNINSDWFSFSDYYTKVDTVPLNERYKIPLSIDVVDLVDSTTLVLRSTDHDVNNSSYNVDFQSFNGIDFSNVTLDVEIEPFLVRGIDYIKTRVDKTITLYANKNTLRGELRWYREYDGVNFSNQIGTGNSTTIYTNEYIDDNDIYVAIIESGETLSINVLNIKIDLYEEVDDVLGRKNKPFDIDIDSTYFKYHKCLSGICYTYVRDLSDAYEQNIQVSDGNGLGSYNLYNEFDVIDEFYSNSHEVEIAIRMDNIDLNQSYKVLDGQYIHEGTRVLFYSTPASSKDGVYVADYNLKFKKLDELSSIYKSFRYKAHVNAGTYLDYEFHTSYYDPDTVDTTDGDFVFGIINASLYDDVLLDLGSYSDDLFDSNIE